MHITNLISQYFGKFAKKEFPSFFQSIINNIYVKSFHLDMSEFRNPKYYKSLNDLFTRELAIQREIELDDDLIISPTDSLITECGALKKDTLLQIKGMEYNVEELLTYHVKKDNLEKVIDGSFMNFYLSPKDYHRYHAPCDFNVSKLIHVPGKLYPVNLKYLNKEIDLFCQNERVILECIDKNKKLFYMVFVGALNVGQMVFEFESAVETNVDAKEIKVYEYEDLNIKKGECLGYFKMGSTVVMIWEKGSIKLKNLTNQKILFGSSISKK
ncbi:phosphatidylserine decarboxylase [Arcobacter nitrofigilis DSM 7299]|uniref:phosphatidylserine decarboxylase n=1 Tax=Arcobacter nitrofigilis (strain ATCC 33309 / DSM 7299 / CCUG 15893 / LMG 7604 / NCTC 12251 / CI) TaxID=572480 RepID=D5V7C3_ARCNC|nr:phosphatidylserine decarboxylase [Arcobacter nitrofigilis]ADG94543.1 phosphatidylserine decarboxylase [Arcobacter nitrofigilis DSM 7299]